MKLTFEKIIELLITFTALHL